MTVALVFSGSTTRDRNLVFGAPQTGGLGFPAAGSLVLIGYPAELVTQTPPAPVGELFLYGYAADLLARVPGVAIEAAPAGAMALSASAADFFDSVSFAPYGPLPGYSCDGTSMIIPISSLPGVSVVTASAEGGDWRVLVQALCTVFHNWINDTNLINKPQATKMFMLEDWNRKDARFGRHMKRSFSMQFITKPPIADIVEE